MKRGNKYISFKLFEIISKNGRKIKTGTRRLVLIVKVDEKLNKEQQRELFL